MKWQWHQRNGESNNQSMKMKWRIEIIMAAIMKTQ
jgi:hypothetical protein